MQDPNIRNAREQTPRDVAANRGLLPELVKVLAEVNAVRGG